MILALVLFSQFHIKTLFMFEIWKYLLGCRKVCANFSKYFTQSEVNPKLNIS